MSRMSRTEKQENNFTGINTARLISNLHNKENEKQFLKNMIKKSAKEIHKLELQLRSHNEYLHSLMIKYNEINKKCELVIKNAANLADNISAIQEDTFIEKLYSENIKLTAENYYLSKQIENNAKTNTDFKIKIKPRARIYFPPMCQRHTARAE